MAEFWLCVSAVQNATKAISTLNTLRKFERAVNESAMEQFMFLFNQLEAMDEPLKVLMQLQCREATLPYVDPQVRMAKKSIEVVETFLGDDLPDLEGGEQEEEEGGSWGLWLLKKKDGKEKKDQLQDISSRLQRTIEVMNLSLMTLITAVPQEHREPRAHFRWLHSVHEAAVAMYVELSTGRIERRAICAGQLWQHSLTSCVTGGSKARVHRRRCVFVLCKKEREWVIEVQPAPETALRDMEAGFDAFELPLNRSLTVHRYWGGDASAKLDGLRGVLHDSILYSFKNSSTEVALQFEAVDRIGNERSQRCITAELFELLIFMLITNHQDEDTLRKLLISRLPYIENEPPVDRMGNLYTAPK